MPLKVSHGIKSWIDDFQQSKDKRFDGKSAEKRREMAIAAYMAAKREQKENVKTADKKPEMYTKPDGKRGTRMVPVDREVVKQEKNLEWLKAALEAQARKTKPCDEDVEETAEAIDMSKVGTKATIMHPVTRVSKKVDKKDVQKHVDSGWLHMGQKKNRITKSRKEATIPDGQTAMTKKPEISKKDKETVGKIQALMKRANEDDASARMYRDNPDMMKQQGPGGFKSLDPKAKKTIKKAMKKLPPKPTKEDVNEISIDKLSRYGKAAAKDVQRQRDKVKGALDQPLSTKHQKAGMAAMKKLTKRSKGSDMYVDKMTGRSKVKPSAATVGKDKHVSVENYAQKSADRHKMLMKQARSDMKNAKSHSDMIKHMNKYQSAKKAHDRATRGQFDENKGIEYMKKVGNKKADAEADERKKVSELSNAKMGQYVRKAADDAARKASKGDVVGARQRVKGVNKAMDKIDHNRLFGRSG